MKKLTEVRLAYGKSKSDMAKVVGVTRQAYANYENNVRKPSMEVLKKLAEFYGIKVDELIDYEPDKIEDRPKFTAAIIRAMEVYSKLPEERRLQYLEMMRYDLEFFKIK